jgi:hypothetical protein
LLAAIAEECSVIEDGWRRIGGGDPDTLLTCLWRELSETLLPTRLRLRNASGDTIEILAGNHCLVRLYGPLPAGLDGCGDLCDAELTGDDPSVLVRICALFRTHGAGQGVFWLRGASLDAASAGATGGIAASKLAALSDLPGPAQTEQIDFDAIADQTAAQADIWARFSGGQFQSGENCPEEVRDLFAALGTTTKTDPLDGLSVVTLRAARGEALLIASVQDDTVCALMTADLADRLALHWAG